MSDVKKAIFQWWESMSPEEKEKYLGPKSRINEIHDLTPVSIIEKGGRNFLYYVTENDLLNIYRAFEDSADFICFTNINPKTKELHIVYLRVSQIEKLVVAIYRSEEESEE